ncbi:MAG: 4Fe-4S dicluster domain-containing protein [Phycisphaerales bacterium]
MQYGFVIDQTRCIGCHACTVACKAENDVPIGNFRTSVKYTELGQFPDVRRHFAVLRCNQCSDAPCVTICPVNALEKRPDGIVDVDRDACIGCRACMQACPYDALYLNDDLGAVEKCHFCAHRIEKGLEPACVVVCPVQAIIPGDLDDPNSKPAQIIADNDTKVRRPEQGTGPNVHYLGADDVSLNPGHASRPPTYLWSDRPPHKGESWPASVPTVLDATTTLDVGHRVEWGWAVSLYLLTKSIAAGAAMLAPFAAAFGMTGFAASYLPEILALVLLAVTCFLLVEDLARPMLFYRLLTMPNWNSWLVRGGIILGVFGLLISFGIVLRVLHLQTAANAFRLLSAVTASAVAGYTAFLFAQCKGRDLWESPLLLPHLLAQATLCGSVCFLPFAASSLALKLVVVISIVAHLLLSLVERFRAQPTENAKQAAGFLSTVTLGPLSAFRDGLIISVIVSLVLIFILPEAVFVPALFGLYLYEHAYIRAAQLPPLS